MVQIDKRRNIPANAGRAHFAPFIARPNNLEWFETVPGERVAIHVHSSKVGGRYCVMESRAAPGSHAPLHYHAEDEVVHVVEGVLSVIVGGEVVEVDAGTTIVVPGRSIHAWENRGAQTVRMFATFFPGGIEELFQSLGDLPPDQVEAVARRYGTVIIPDGPTERPGRARMNAAPPPAVTALAPGETDWS